MKKTKKMKKMVKEVAKRVERYLKEYGYDKNKKDEEIKLTAWSFLAEEGLVGVAGRGYNEEELVKEVAKKVRL